MLKNVIAKLMNNDRNGSWDECETIEQIIEGLREALKQYQPDDDEYKFYHIILKSNLYGGD
jgi:hypothetical protein